MVKEKKGRKGNREESVGDEADIKQNNSTEIETNMSKSKKKDRRKKGEWEDDVADEIATLASQEKNITDEQVEEPPTKKKEKKKTRKNEKNLNDLDVTSEEGAISNQDGEKDMKISSKNNKKNDAKSVSESNSHYENNVSHTVKESKKDSRIKKPKSVFELLEDEGMDTDESDKEESSEQSKEMTLEIEAPDRTKELKKEKVEKVGKKSKKEMKKKEEEEEIERMLAEIELGDSKKKGKKEAKKKEVGSEGEPQQVLADNETDDTKMNKQKVKEEAQEIEEKGLTIVTEVTDDEEDEKPKKKGKKKKGEEKQIEETQEDNKQEDEDEFTLKSAAQKKKEKKEREKQKKLTQKEKAKKVKDDVKPVENKEAVETKQQLEPAIPDELEEDEGEDDDDTKKGKKDKKKKKTDKDKDDKDKKRPGKKQILAMQEALKKLKEEEEKRRLEEEEKQRQAEEAERLRQEKLQLEQERKEKRKQKEKEKRDRLKAEGKLLTQSQKQQRARAQAMLESLRARGLDVPAIGEKKEKAFRPGDRIRPKKSKAEVQEEQENEESKESSPEVNAISDVVDKAETPAQEEKEPEMKEIEIDEKEEESIKDAWDESSGGEDEDEEEEEDDDEKETDAILEKELVQDTVQKKEPEDDEENKSSSSESDEESESESEEESESESESETEQKTASEKIHERALSRIQKRREMNEKNRIMEKLRSPVVCVLGHVDTGKTKILDKIRHTHVQDSEAGGITQQIGATMVPLDAIGEQCRMVKNFSTNDIKIPGLLIIDTPGHESFSNLRSRGSSLCDIAILVVDIMHGLEPQTIESINLLKQKKTPFIVALNKIDRLYEWKHNKNKDVQDTLKNQNRHTHLEFEERCKSVILQFAEQGLNATLFYENKDPRTFISLVPTSAMSGDGMGNLIALIVELTQTMMAKRLAFSEELQATVLEVKAVPGLGTTIDVILVNGRMREGDTLILAGIEGPLVTQIRSLLMPQPLKELRVKNPYQEYKEVEGAQGVKVTGKDLDKSIAGLNVLIAQKPDEVEILKEEVAKELQAVMNSIKLAERGVYVQASTLGSLEALLEFLSTSKIPYSGIRIGPVVKKDVMKASIMLEHDNQYAVILAFDVKIERDAQELADSLGVKIFAADIIYHLFDKFTAYREELKQKKREQFKHIAVFPCRLRILPQFIFNTRDPIVVGVSVEAGVVREGTPLCVPTKEFLEIGIVSTIEVNHKPMESARKGQEVCIKIENIPGETPKLYGRHFDYNDHLVSKITRQSIDACKDYFRDDLQKSDWQLMVELKKTFKIM